MKQVRKLIGKALKEYREKSKMPQDVAIECLKDLKIACSKPNLSKIERDIIKCRADILAGLCLVYDVDINDVVYELKKSKAK